MYRISIIGQEKQKSYTNVSNQISGVRHVSFDNECALCSAVDLVVLCGPYTFSKATKTSSNDSGLGFSTMKPGASQACCSEPHKRV